MSKVFCYDEMLSAPSGCNPNDYHPCYCLICDLGNNSLGIRIFFLLSFNNKHFYCSNEEKQYCETICSFKNSAIINTMKQITKMLSLFSVSVAFGFENATKKTCIELKLFEHNGATHPRGRQVNICAFRMISLDKHVQKEIK